MKTDKPITAPYPGQIAAYLDPNAGISGQISANVQVLVVSGGIKGSLSFATIDIPVSGGVVVRTISPFTIGFGDSLSLKGKFLLGSVDLNVEIWKCCCWTCWWDCCWRCGGSCNSVWTKNLFTWDGYDVTVPIHDRSDLCATLLDGSNIPPTPYDGQAALGIIMDSDMPAPDQVGIGEVDPDSVDYCDCEDTGYWLRDRYVDYTPYFKRSEGAWSKGAIAPLYISAMYEKLTAQTFTYDCSITGYPDVCINTMCYFYYSKVTGNFHLNYDDTRVNRRKFSLSGLPTAPGYDRDEVPMNKCTEGGCCARIQAMSPSENRKHGATFCGFLNREFGPKGFRPQTAGFDISTPGIGTPSLAECRNTDFRYIVGSKAAGKTYWQPPTLSNCPGGCGAGWPGYLVMGRPRKQNLQLLVFHDGDTTNHPNLRYDAEDLARVQVDPQAHPDYIILHSRLENLTVAGTLLVVNCQAANKLGEKHVLEASLARGPTASILLRLAREILQESPPRDDENGHVEMPIDTVWSHLVANKDAPRIVWEVFSEARVVPTIRLSGGGSHHSPPKPLISDVKPTEKEAQPGSGKGGLPGGSVTEYFKRELTSPSFPYPPP